MKSDSTVHNELKSFLTKLLYFSQIFLKNSHWCNEKRRNKFKKSGSWKFLNASAKIISTCCALVFCPLGYLTYSILELLFSLLYPLLKSTMEDVKDLSVKLTKWHKYSPQYKVELTKNGNKMDRTIVMGYPSVAVVIFNKTRQKLVLIKQFRIQHMFASIRENVSEPTADDHQKMNEICKGNYCLIKYYVIWPINYVV